MLIYQDSTEGISPARLGDGFFEGWPSPPTPDAHLRLLHGSSHVCLALDQEVVVGFINAITDGTLCAFIPLLEVLPPYRGRGIGSELVRRMLSRLEGFYAVDLCCDEELVPFYRRFGMTPGRAMLSRRVIHNDCG